MKELKKISLNQTLAIHGYKMNAAKLRLKSRNTPVRTATASDDFDMITEWKQN